MKTSEKFLAFAAEGDKTINEFVELLGVSKQRVSQLGKRYGVAFQGSPKGPRRPVPEFTPNRWGGSHRISPGWVGCAGELIVAADLIRRGFMVYRSMARIGPFDLYAYSDDKGYRVEVRSVSNGNPNGYCADWTHVDLLARVYSDGRIIYDPELGE